MYEDRKEPVFDLPVPGMGMTHELGARPWQQPAQYTTIDDVKMTIKKLENLYKKGKYPHKRIWQVGMIMKVRLEAMLKHKKSLYPNAIYVKPRYNLANRYFKFLGERTKEKDDKKRKQMLFKI